MMNPIDMQNYVRATALVLALPLDDVQVGRVSLHLARTHGMAVALQAFPLAVDVEPAEIFCPAPFPSPAGDEPA